MNRLKYKKNKITEVRMIPLGQKKIICVFTVTCQKNLGLVGWH